MGREKGGCVLLGVALGVRYGVCAARHRPLLGYIVMLFVWMYMTCSSERVS